LKEENHRRFQSDLGRLHPSKRIDTADGFNAFLAQLPGEIAALEKQVSALVKEEQAMLNAVATVKSEYEANEKEVASLVRQPTSIPEEFLARRDNIAESLGVPRAEMPFVGELIQVDPTYEKWTGAIEALLHSFALTILVHRDHRDMVDSFVSLNNMRGRIEYDIVDSGISAPSKRSAPNTVAGRINIKPDAPKFEAYVQRELNHRFSHVCCEKTDQSWHGAEQALTITGLIKTVETGCSAGTTRRNSTSFVPAGETSTRIRARPRKLTTMSSRSGGPPRAAKARQSIF
jgi:uncharacterized protein YPO0396